MRSLLCARKLPHLPHEPCTLQGTLRASTLLFPQTQKTSSRSGHHYSNLRKRTEFSISIFRFRPLCPCVFWLKKNLYFGARKKTRANKDQEMLPGPDRSYYSRPNSGPTEGQRYMVEFIFLYFLFLLSFQLNICRVFKYQAVISCIKLKVNHLFISLFISIKSNSRLSLQLRCGR